MKTYFNFNKRERNGIIFLFALIASIILVNISLDYFYSPSVTDFTKFSSEINIFTQDEKKTQIPKSSSIVDSLKTKLFIFDPNNVSKEDLERLGLNKKIRDAWVNYILKGGKFRKKEDIQKIYGLTEIQYTTLLPYVKIEFKSLPENKLAENIVSTKSNRGINKIELNSADSNLLTELYGIGPILANRIIKYRNSLGGFYTTKQLTEVYGIDEQKLQNIDSSIYINLHLIKAININKCTANEISKHPYISFNQSNSIVNIRLMHGNYVSIVDLKKSELINDSLFNKISHYLSIE